MSNATAHRRVQFVDGHLSGKSEVFEKPLRREIRRHYMASDGTERSQLYRLLTDEEGREVYLARGPAMDLL